MSFFCFLYLLKAIQNMNLIIDIGNTRAKLAVFEQDKLVHKNTTQTKNFFENVEKLLVDYPKIKIGIISSVAFFSEKEKNTLKKMVKLLIINAEMELPFQNKYKTPNTLGQDRIALIAAAVKLHPNQNTLVIDAGTCITYDFINAENEYLGGSISLGLTTRYNALHNLTAKLPLLKLEEDNNYLIGNTTEKSIHSGVINGVINEIEGNINNYKSLYQNLTIILTGGDTNFLANRLKSSIFANSNFLLLGLNHLLQINNN